MPVDPENNAVLIPNHGDQMVARMPQQFHRTRTLALIQALGVGIQCMEAEAFGVLTSTSLQVASGDALDQWGILVGERRGGLADDDFRVFIEARILVNKSNGSSDELIEIWLRITAPQISVRLETYTLASFSMWVLRSSPMGAARARRVGAFMREVKPAGASMFLVESVTGYFGFFDDPGHPGVEADDGASLGFDDGLLSRVL